MNIYKVVFTGCDYDEYDSFVVAAESAFGAEQLVKDSIPLRQIQTVGVLGYDVKEPNIASNKDGSIGSYTGSYYWLLTNQKPYYGNWKDSLEERPNDLD